MNNCHYNLSLLMTVFFNDFFFSVDSSEESSAFNFANNICFSAVNAANTVLTRVVLISVRNVSG